MLTMDSFNPIRFSSSSSRRSDMWLPIPILLFICASACCWDEVNEKLSRCKRLKTLGFSFGCNRLTLISFAISGDKFRCSLIPDLAASTVETLNSLNASSMCSGVATLVLRTTHMSARNAMIFVCQNFSHKS